MTIGELYEIHEELSELEENAKAGEPVEEIKKSWKSRRNLFSIPAESSSGESSVRRPRRILLKRQRRQRQSGKIRPLITRPVQQMRSSRQKSGILPNPRQMKKKILNRSFLMMTRRKTEKSAK